MNPTCGGCNHPFDLEGRLPFSGECGHSMCQECVYNSHGNCSTCKRDDAFESPVYNYQLILQLPARPSTTNSEFMKQFDELEVDDFEPLQLLNQVDRMKVAQNVQRLKEELEETLDMTLCHSGNKSVGELLFGRGPSFKKSVLDSCEKMLESPTWEEFEAEEARLKMVVKTMTTHYKEVADSVGKYVTLFQFVENELKKTAQ